MSWRRRGVISVFVIALLSPTSVRAGTTPAPSEPSPTEPISQLSQLLNYVRKGGPEGRIVRGVSYGETTDEAKIVVSNAFHRMSYQERLQMVQEFGFTWGKINPSMNATALVVDDRGNLLGRRSPNGNIWVDR